MQDGASNRCRHVSSAGMKVVRRHATRSASSAARRAHTSAAGSSPTWDSMRKPGTPSSLTNSAPAHQPGNLLSLAGTSAAAPIPATRETHPCGSHSLLTSPDRPPSHRRRGDRRGHRRERRRGRGADHALEGRRDLVLGEMRDRRRLRCRDLRSCGTCTRSQRCRGGSLCPDTGSGACSYGRRTQVPGTGHVDAASRKRVRIQRGATPSCAVVSRVPTRSLVLRCL